MSDRLDRIKREYDYIKERFDFEFKPESDACNIGRSVEISARLGSEFTHFYGTVDRALDKEDLRSRPDTTYIKGLRDYRESVEAMSDELQKIAGQLNRRCVCTPK